MEKITKTKMTQTEFDALKRNEIGYLVIPECTDCTDIDFGAVDRVIFGDCCKLGNGCELGSNCELGDGCELGNDCKLGEWCTLGDRCKLGNGCELGDWCKLGNGCVLGVQCVLGMCCFDKRAAFEDARATFEDGRVQDGLYMQYGSIGSDHRTFSFYIDKNETMFVRAGCWFGEMNDFKARVKDVHGGTTEAQYMAACSYAEMELLPRLRKSDATRIKKK